MLRNKRVRLLMFVCVKPLAIVPALCVGLLVSNSAMMKPSVADNVGSPLQLEIRSSEPLAARTSDSESLVLVFSVSTNERGGASTRPPTSPQLAPPQPLQIAAGSAILTGSGPSIVTGKGGPMVPSGERTFQDLGSGDVLRSSDILDMLQQEVHDSYAEAAPLFGPSLLSVYFENVTTGLSESFAVANCQGLDFVPSQSGLGDQQVLCDGDLYQYGTTPLGLEVTRNGEQLMSLSLEPGVYQLNGLPFQVAYR